MATINKTARAKGTHDLRTKSGGGSGAKALITVGGRGSVPPPPTSRHDRWLSISGNVFPKMKDRAWARKSCGKPRSILLASSSFES